MVLVVFVNQLMYIVRLNTWVNLYSMVQIVLNKINIFTYRVMSGMVFWNSKYLAFMFRWQLKEWKHCTYPTTNFSLIVYQKQYLIWLNKIFRSQWMRMMFQDAGICPWYEIIVKYIFQRAHLLSIGNSKVVNIPTILARVWRVGMGWRL